MADTIVDGPWKVVSTKLPSTERELVQQAAKLGHVSLYKFCRNVLVEAARAALENAEADG